MRVMRFVSQSASGLIGHLFNEFGVVDDQPQEDEATEVGDDQFQGGQNKADEAPKKERPLVRSCLVVRPTMVSKTKTTAVTPKAIVTTPKSYASKIADKVTPFREV